MKISVSAANSWIAPLASGALSSVRSEVVPVATVRSPGGAAALSRAAQRGRTGGDDAAAGGARGVQPRCGFGVEHRALGMHLVLRGIGSTDRKECAGTHMQRHALARDSFGLQPREQVRR